jgi:nicotinamidase-related amidase
MSRALLLIDIQNDYFPGGAMELVGSFEAAERARALLEAFRGAGLPVIHMQHVSVRPGATFFLPDTPGVEIHERVAPAPGETVFRKHFPNSFRETGLLEHLRAARLSALTIAGMMTHMCVDSTTRAAADLGFECTLAGDACATRALTLDGTAVPADSVHRAFLAALNGLFARVMPAERIVAEVKS